MRTAAKQSCLYTSLFQTSCWIYCWRHTYIDGLVQDCSNSIANALELLQSCAKPSIFSHFLSSLKTEKAQVLEILPCGRRPNHNVYTITWLLMTW